MNRHNDKSIFLFPHTPKNHDLFDDLIEVVRLGLLLGFPNLLTKGSKPYNPTDIRIVLNAIFCSPHQGSRISFNLAAGKLVG